MEREGFSLIELIIVIAIMAILIGVIALVVLPYLESARESRDRQTLSEVSNAFKSAMANETVANGIGDTYDDYAKPADPLLKKMNSYMDGTVETAEGKLASKACKGKEFRVKATKDADGKWTMSACIADKSSGAIAVDSENKNYEQ